MKLSTGTTALVLISHAHIISAFINGGGPSQAFPTLPNFARTFSKFGSYAPSQHEFESNFLLKDFQTSEGDVVKPYSVLNIHKNANAAEIKQQYRKMSKMYHPDIVMHSRVLPGKCNDLNDVRKEWERITLSYDILSDENQRLRYDRNSALIRLPDSFETAVASFTNGMSTAAKTLGQGYETGKKVIKTVDFAMAEIALQMKQVELALQEKEDAEIANEISAAKSMEKTVSVPPPPKGQYYSPFDACSIIKMHEIHPLMDKPKAMRLMIENEYIPVQKGQLYNVYRQFKDGKVKEQKEWRKARPNALTPSMYFCKARP